MGMFESDYQLAWAVYLIGAVGCLAVGFVITGWMWRWLREVIRLVGAVLLFTPTLVDPERMLYAPAIAIAALDLLFATGNNVWQAASDLTIFAIVGFALYLVLVVLRWLVGRLIARPPAGDSRTLSERIAEQADDDFDDRRVRGLRADPRY